MPIFDQTEEGDGGSDAPLPPSSPLIPQVRSRERVLGAWLACLREARWQVSWGESDGSTESNGVPPDDAIWLVKTQTLKIWRLPGAGSAAAAVEQEPLTRKETEVRHWARQGKSLEEIAIILGCRRRTVEKHLENIYRKLDLSSRRDLLLGQ